MAFFWQNPMGSLAENRRRARRYEANQAYFVYELSRGRLGHELGPYSLDSARTYARISATEGTHDRVVTRGRDGPIVRRYAAGSGERLMDNPTRCSCND